MQPFCPEESILQIREQKALRCKTDLCSNVLPFHLRPVVPERRHLGSLSSKTKSCTHIDWPCHGSSPSRYRGHKRATEEKNFFKIASCTQHSVWPPLASAASFIASRARDAARFSAVGSKHLVSRTSEEKDTRRRPAEGERAIGFKNRSAFLDSARWRARPGTRGPSSGTCLFLLLGCFG